MSTSPPTLHGVLDLLRSAPLEDLFPLDPVEAKRTYRSMARLCHPDSHPDDTTTAEETFALLARLWAEFIAAGRQVLTTRSRSYVLDQERYQGDIATLLDASYSVGGVDQAVLVKIPRSHENNDLLEREARALTLLEDVEPQFQSYVPRLVETFRHQDAATLQERRVNVLESLEGFFSLAEVMAAYPGGLDLRDAAWMWRRLLVAVGLAHRAGLVHGAVNPNHVLIHPEMHGLTLVDWCYSAQIALESIPALSPSFRSTTAPEVLQRQAATPATDLYMVAALMRSLVMDPPPPLAALLASSLRSEPSQRPQDAWLVLKDLDAALEGLYGPRRFRPFAMPDPRVATP